MIEPVLEAIYQQGGRPFFVGGYVRDRVMKIEPHDMDIEVYGLSKTNLINILCEFGRVDEYTKQFGILKLWLKGTAYDFALPRVEIKRGDGHKGFDISVQPHMTLKKSLARRDFTMNAMAMNPFTGAIYDPYMGQTAIAHRMLVPVSEHFMEDPLRVLRGMQFAGRFNMFASSDLVMMSNTNEYSTLTKDRIWEEWYKLLKSDSPGTGMYYLNDMGWLHLYPAIDKLVDIQQDPNQHPEGHAFRHTMLTMNGVADLTKAKALDDEKRAILALAALCHDMGKINTTQVINGRIVSPGHNESGNEIIHDFLTSIGCPNYIRQYILPLVKHHTACMQHEISVRMVRRLSIDLVPANIEMLSMLMRADTIFGRNKTSSVEPWQIKAINTIACAIAVENSAPARIITGKHLLDLGYPKGKHYSVILDTLYERQLDGEFDDEAGGLVALAKLFPICPVCKCPQSEGAPQHDNSCEEF